MRLPTREMVLQRILLLTCYALLAPLCFVAMCLAADPADSNEADKKIGKLQLVGGDIYRGRFGENQSSDGSLLWQCPAFVSDLEIPWNAVDNIVLPEQTRAGKERDAAARFVVERQNGEAITGSITQISDQFVEVDSELVGKKQIPLGSVRSILRAFAKTETDAGELRQSEWKQIAPPIKKQGRGNWFDGHGSYDTETAGTVISQSVNFPDLATIEVHASWQSSTPNWLLQIGEPRKLEIHVRKVENKNHLTVTVLVEDETTADIATAALPLDSSNALSLQLLCDSVRGRLVLMHNGNPVAQIAMKKSLRLTGRQSVLFTNNVSGRLSLRSLKIYRSVFSSPVVMSQGKDATESGNITSPETLLQNGQTYVGRPIAFDASDNSFGFETTETNIGRVSMAQVDRIEFPPIAEIALPAIQKKHFSVQLWSGDRYVGQSISIQAQHLILFLEESKLEVRIPIGDVMTVGQNGTAKAGVGGGANEKVDEENRMRFVSPWGVSFGQIATEPPIQNGSSAKLAFRTLNWKPLHALQPVALSAGVTGVIEPLSKKNIVEKSKPKTTADFGRPLEKDEPSLFLKSGDCFSAEVTGLQEGELYFKSPLFSTNKIDASLVRGIRKLAYTGTETMEKLSRKRLLTLPRSQRGNPPTHLIVSREGDAIRGQLQSMDVDDLTLLVRGEDRKIQMKTVAEIIWLLDAPEIVPPGKSEAVATVAQPVGDVKAKPQMEDLNCQALDASGTRISIIPERVEGDVLYGQHPQLGPCQVDLRSLTRLVLGEAIVADIKQNRFEKWKLENAVDPKFVNDLDAPDAPGGSGAESTPSRMIDKAAPDFELSKLDGTPLKLSSLQGRIVVLDFWATWCGPCVASLPKITELGQEYKGANVDVIAVNIEETSVAVRAFLDRIKISPVVVLDTDGAVAKTYQATAIPQTVIIDRDGKVKHVIVGGGAQSEAKIREFLDGMLNVKL